MNVVTVFVGSLDEYSFIMLVNVCFVRTVLTKRRGSSVGVFVVVVVTVSLELLSREGVMSI